MGTSRSKVDDLTLKILKLHPELWSVAQITARARQALSFPIRDVHGLLALADKTGTEEIRIDFFTITLRQAERYFPKSFFPIADEDDFITKVLIALLWARQAHGFEAQLTFKTAPQSPTDADDEKDE